MGIFDYLLARKPAMSVGGGIDGGASMPFGSVGVDGAATLAGAGGGIDGAVGYVGGGGFKPSPFTVGGLADVGGMKPSQDNPLMTILGSLLNPQKPAATPGTDLGALFAQIQQSKDPVGYANKMSGIGMSQVPNNPYNPFTNGFFKPRTY